jgi:hypothetical protein
MSYPSIKEIVAHRGLDLQNANENQIKPVLLEAFRVDLSNGMSFLEKLAAEVKATGKRLLHIESPNSPLGKQLIRLLGADISRKLVTENLGVAFGFYNCCNVVCALDEAALHMTCTTVEKYSAAFVDRELSARLRRNAMLHLATCPPCRDVIEMQKRGDFHGATVLKTCAKVFCYRNATALSCRRAAIGFTMSGSCSKRPMAGSSVPISPSATAAFTTATKPQRCWPRIGISRNISP